MVKGQKVLVTGTLTQKQINGKTYNDVVADSIEAVTSPPATPHVFPPTTETWADPIHDDTPF